MLLRPRPCSWLASSWCPCASRAPSQPRPPAKCCCMINILIYILILERSRRRAGAEGAHKQASKRASKRPASQPGRVARLIELEAIRRGKNFKLLSPLLPSPSCCYYLEQSERFPLLVSICQSLGVRAALLHQHCKLTSKESR